MLGAGRDAGGKKPPPPLPHSSPPGRSISRAGAWGGGKAGRAEKQASGDAGFPRSASLSGPLAGDLGGGRGWKAAPKREARGAAPHSRGFSVPPPLGELSPQERGLRVRVSFTGTKVPRADRFPHTTTVSPPHPDPHFLNGTAFSSSSSPIWSRGRSAPPGGGQGPAGPGRRERRLKDVTQVPSAPCSPATVALQIGAERASPQRLASTTPLSPRLVQGGRWGKVGTLPRPRSGLGLGVRGRGVQDAEKIPSASLRVLRELCKMFLKTFPSGLYLEFREYRHVSNKSCVNIVQKSTR